ncbi:hypothetical protein [Promicromonospora sukumoe]|uniref:hypothetical protein n=1 Tax=Promicromonospora sukumoe TaxID=88382 RepID=UPI0012FC0199|nr:hypothetical protein [Promicromonospora sukumoe]
MGGLLDRVPDGGRVGGGQVGADPGHGVVGGVEVDRAAGHRLLGHFRGAVQAGGVLVHLVAQPAAGAVGCLGQVAGDRLVAFLDRQGVAGAQQDVGLGGVYEAVVQGVHDLGVLGQAAPTGHELVRVGLRDAQAGADLGRRGGVLGGPAPPTGDLSGGTRLHRCGPGDDVLPAGRDVHQLGVTGIRHLDIGERADQRGTHRQIHELRQLRHTCPVGVLEHPVDERACGASGAPVSLPGHGRGRQCTLSVDGLRGPAECGGCRRRPRMGGQPTGKGGLDGALDGASRNDYCLHHPAFRHETH